MNKKLRLLMWGDCDRNCELCCNKQFDLNTIPKCLSYQPYDEIILTGGEPMLYPATVLQTIDDIRRVNPGAKIFMHTAKVDTPWSFAMVFSALDGVTVTMHDTQAWLDLFKLELWLKETPGNMGKSSRLYYFEDRELTLPGNLGRWKPKRLEWLEECPVPEGEDFMRL